MKIIKDHKITQQLTEPCTPGTEGAALTEMCKQCDLPVPLWLNKHVSEYNQFRRTVFTREHFMEDIEFDRMEIEYLDDTGVKRKSRDPRNQF